MKNENKKEKEKKYSYGMRKDKEGKKIEKAENENG